MRIRGAIKEEMIHGEVHLSPRGKRVGYIRVSTAEQNSDRQLVGIELDKKFEEKISSKAKERPQLQAMLDYIREDDMVYVHSMDRLARNVIELRTLVERITGLGASVLFVKENLKFDSSSSSMSTLLLSIMGAFAEFEHAYIMERQREGIAIAKLKGKYTGRQRCLNSDQIDSLRKDLQTNKSKTFISKKYNISRSCLYRYIKEYELLKE